MNRRRPSVPHHRGRLPLHSARPLFSPRPSLPSAVSFLRSAPVSHSASPLHGSRAASPLRGMGRSPSPSPPPPHSQRVSLAPQQPAFGLQRRRSIRDALEAIETGQLVPQSRKRSLLAANSPSGLIPGMNNPLILDGFGRSGSTVKFAFDADQNGRGGDQLNQRGVAVIGSANIHNEFGICGWILTVLSYILIFLTLPISACMSIKVVQEYERAVIFRLGRLLPGGAKGPGIFFIVPCIDTYRKVDLRVLSFEVPPQEILSKDSVTVAVDAVVYFRISNATISVTNVEDASRSTKLLAQTTLRNILGTKTLAEMLSDREAISLQMQATLDEATEPWGVKVERVEVKDVRLPVQLQRAMAAEAEAAREARAKVIVAEGEQKASRALKEAADVIAESPQAIQLRYLQTLNSISAEKNSTIIFPFPIDLLSSLLHPQQLQQKPQPPALAQPLQQYAQPQSSASIAQQQNCPGSFSGPFSSTAVVDTQFKHQKARQL